MRKQEQELQNMLNYAQDEFVKCPSPATKIKLLDAKNKLEELYDKKVEGAIFRSKITWSEEGERNTKYFLNLERRNYAKKHIKKLMTDDKLITNPKEILEAQSQFYKLLYAKDNSVFSEEDFEFFINNCKIPTLDEQLRESCEGEITEKECDEIIKTFADGKTPGNDGLPAEFYKTFWALLKPVLVECYNTSYCINQLSLSQTQAVITLIEKKDSDRTLLKNWRPISLPNVDYKIMSKVLASRMMKVLQHLIHPSQTAYVKGRYIGENLRIIEDIFNYTNEENIPGFLLVLDFEKALDSLNWNFFSPSLYLPLAHLF